MQLNLPGTTSGALPLNFALAELLVAFDAERDMWYADIELDSLNGLTGMNLDSAVDRFPPLATPHEH